MVNVPVGAFALWLGARHVRATEERSDGALDPAGQLPGIMTLTLLTTGVIEGGARGWTSIAAVAPLIACVPVALLFVSVQARRRNPMLVGLLCGTAGFLGLIAAASRTAYPWLVAPLVAAGFGMAFTMPAATAAIIEAAPASRAGIASGVLNAARQAGGAIGVALLGTLIARGPFVTGLHEAMGVSAAAFAAGAAVTVVAIRPDGRDACVIMDADECNRRTWLGSGKRRRARLDARDAGRRGQAAPASDGP